LRVRLVARSDEATAAKPGCTGARDLEPEQGFVSTKGTPFTPSTVASMLKT
jgi:hypothetical protein